MAKHSRADRSILIMAAIVVMSRVRILFANGRFWSGLLCAATFSRGTSLIERPPGNNTVTSGAIEAFIGYRAWGFILVAASIAILMAHVVRRFGYLGVGGHMIAMWAYGTFGISTVIAAIGFGQPWANAGTLISQAVLHSACAIFLGDELGHSKEEAKGE